MSNWHDVFIYVSSKKTLLFLFSVLIIWLDSKKKMSIYIYLVNIIILWFIIIAIFNCFK